MDNLNKNTRSWNMSRIPSTNTHPEIAIRKELFSKGYRYRKYVNLKGRPDICFGPKRLLVFVNGCFWHVHGCKNSTFPHTNSAFWKAKLMTNKKRDKKTYLTLKKLGWKVLVIWECEIEKDLKGSTNKIVKYLN